MHWTKKSEKLIRKNPQTVEDPKTEKPLFSSAKTEKQNQTLAKIRKTENTNAPS